MKLWFEHALLPDGWKTGVAIDIEDGRIASLAAGVPPPPRAERHWAAVPGVPNLHSHAFQRGMAGLAEGAAEAGEGDFWTWRQAMYRFVDRLQPDGLFAIAALAYAEMLEAGFTRVGEFHYLHHDPSGAPYADPAEMASAIAAAAAETGIGLSLLPVYYAHSGFGGAPPDAGQRRFLSDCDSYARLLDSSRRAIAPLGDAVLGVAPHSLRAVTADAIVAVAAMLPDAPIHIHVAEQQAEVEASLAWSGRRPVEWLLENAAVDGRWCLVHATHVTPAELRGIARSGAVVGLCPITEANLGDGIFPATDFQAIHGRFGIGSDSNVRIDAAEELRMLEYGQRLERRGRNLLSRPGGSTGASLFDGALLGGAQALGVEAGILPGGAADIVTFRRDDPLFAGGGVETLTDRFIFGGGRGSIDCVWRRGRLVVAGGAHVERRRIAARYRAVMEALLA